MPPDKKDTHEDQTDSRNETSEVVAGEQHPEVAVEQDHPEPIETPEEKVSRIAKVQRQKLLDAVEGRAVLALTSFQSGAEEALRKKSQEARAIVPPRPSKSEVRKKQLFHKFNLAIEFKSHRVKNAGKLAKLVDYMEQNLYENKTEQFESVDPSEVENKIAEMSQKGYSLESESEISSFTSHVYLRFSKYNTFEYNYHDLINLEELANTIKDPARVLNALQGLGLEMYVREFLPQMIASVKTEKACLFLETLGEIGIIIPFKSGWRLTENVEKIAESFGKEDLLGLPDWQKENLRVMFSTVRIDLEDFGAVLEASANPEIIQLLALMNKDGEHLYKDANILLPILNEVSKRGMAQKMVAMLTLPTSVLDVSDFTTHSYSDKTDCVEAALCKLQGALRSQTVERLEDPEVSKIANRLIGLVYPGNKFGFGGVEDFLGFCQEANEKPNFFVLMESLKESDPNFAENFSSLVSMFKGNGAFKSLLDSDQAMAQIIQPEFLTFMSELMTNSGYSFNPRDFLPDKDHPGSIFELFKNTAKADALVSGPASYIAKITGGINLDYSWIYEELAKFPKAKLVIETLVGEYGFYVNLNGPTGQHSDLAELISDEELTDRVLDPHTVSQYKQIKEKYPSAYVSLRDLRGMAQLCDDQSSLDLILNEENVKFINSASAHFHVRDLTSFSRVPENIRDLLIHFRKEFYFQMEPDSSTGSIEFLSNFERIAADPEIVGGLADPEKIKNVARLTRAESAVYDASLTSPDDLKIILALPSGTGEFARSMCSFMNKKFTLKSDMPKLVQLMENKEEIFELLRSVGRSGVQWEYGLDDLLFVQSTCLPNFEKISYYMSFFSPYLRHSIVWGKDISFFNDIAEKNYSPDQDQELIRIINEENNESSFTINLLESAQIYLEQRSTLNSITEKLQEEGYDLSPYQIFHGARGIMELQNPERMEHAVLAARLNPGSLYDFRPREIKSGEIGEERSKIATSDPLEVLLLQKMSYRGKGEVLKDFFENIYSRFGDEDSFRRICACLRRASDKDHYLEEVTSDHQTAFEKAVRKLMEESFKDEEAIDEEYYSFFFSPQAMEALAKEPNKLDFFMGLKESGILSDASQKELIFQYFDKIIDLPPEKVGTYIELATRVGSSPSQEIQKIKDQLIRELLSADDPMGKYEQIENIFTRNNLPYMGKIYKIFVALHSKGELGQTRIGSPFLEAASERAKHWAIYRDLLRVQLDSGNRSLRQYMEALSGHQSVLDKADEHGFESLDADESTKLKSFARMIDTLYENTQLAEGKNDVIVGNDPTMEEVKTDLEILRENLKVRRGQKITDRFAEMFLEPIGINSFDEALTRMKKSKKIAHERNIEFTKAAEGGPLTINPGDLLKGVIGKFISNILQNGSLAREFLGVDAGSDGTPLDTDLAMILEGQMGDKSFKSAVERSMANGYGGEDGILLGIRNRGQFQMTKAGDKPPYDMEKYELFGSSGNEHQGIRTGFPSTEIDFMVVKALTPYDLDNLFYEVAQNGFYIPVCDPSGKIIYTPEMFASYRKTFEGLDRFDGEPLEIVRMQEGDPHAKEIEELVNEIEADRFQVEASHTQIVAAIREVLLTNGVKIKEKHDRSLTGAEIINIGSTARHTNTPGDYDFDLSLKIDDVDEYKLRQHPAGGQQRDGIIDQIRAALRPKTENSHAEPERQFYQLRSLESQAIINSPSIDIGFAKKSELIIYGSHDAVAEKLDWVERNLGHEAYLEVLANIVLAKKELNKGQAYKKQDHGGFGGIGVENWILANGGNMVEAFRNFWEASHREGTELSLEEFAQSYKILDAGWNIKYQSHDNWAKLLKPSGYAAMIRTIGEYLRAHELIED